MRTIKFIVAIESSRETKKYYIKTKGSEALHTIGISSMGYQFSPK